jgi:hypothetical protein
VVDLKVCIVVIVSRKVILSQIFLFSDLIKQCMHVMVDRLDGHWLAISRPIVAKVMDSEFNRRIG